MATFGLCLLAMQGCGLSNSALNSSLGSPVRSASIQGSVHGGQQPIANSTLQLYAVGQTGVASAATPLLTTPVVTGSDGGFSISGLYTCPSATTPVYLTASGGNPGLFQGTNGAIALMAPLGSCGQLGQVAGVTLNEVTTVGTVFSLAPFMVSSAQVGTDASLTSQFTEAWAQVAGLVDVQGGTADSTSTGMSAKINSIANIVASCVNSAGGSAGDGSVCGRLFSYTTDSGVVPADTIAAVLQMARNPSLQASSLFALSGPVTPFEPRLTTAPSDWGLLSSSGVALAVDSPVVTTPPVVVTPPISTPPVTPDPPVVVTPPVVTTPVVTTPPVTTPPVTTPPVVSSPPVVTTPPVVVPTMTLTLSSLLLNVGRNGAGTVALNAAAPSGGLAVSLSSSVAGLLNLPQTVTVAEGQTSARFVYAGTAPGTTLMTASANGYGSQSASLIVELPVASPSMFGLTVLDYANTTPKLSFGTTRSWDAYPGLDWADANPAPGVYNFGPLNAFIALNQARGAQIVYTFGRTPQWASTSPNTPGYYFPGQCGAPALSAWDAYVTAIVTTAAGRIKYWELWNEPDQGGTWCSDIPTMVTLAQHAYSIIKGIDPTAQVLSPAAVGGAGASWLANFLSQGGKGTFDIVAFHGYEGTIAEAINPIANVYRNAMWWFGIDELPLWDTECSWGNNPIGDDAHRAAFLAKYFILQFSNGVDRTLWYAYDGDPGWGRLIDDSNNLLPDGVAYAQVQSWLLGSTLTQPCAQDSNGTWTCGIARPGGYSAQVVWNSSTTVAAGVPTGMTQYRDLSGAVTSVQGGTVSAGNLPILFESGP